MATDATATLSDSTLKRGKAKSSSFSHPMVCETIVVDQSPDSVIARGGREELPDLRLPAPVCQGHRILWIDLSGKRTQCQCFLLVCFALYWLPSLPMLLNDTFASRAAAYVQADMATLAGVCIAGFCAQLVDGALGMGYGLTSSTVLVMAGLSPVVASQCVHLAQLGTTLLSGLSHHSRGTVDWPTTWRIALPGVVGALFGASVLSVLPISAAKTMSSALLFIVGAYLSIRFLGCPSGAATGPSSGKPRYLLVPVGALGGFVDVAGGGGWGPVATSGLLAEGRLAPRHCIGTVSMSEFFVTVAAVVGFALASGHGLDLTAGNSAALRLDLLVSALGQTRVRLTEPMVACLLQTCSPSATLKYMHMNLNMHIYRFPY